MIKKFLAILLALVLLVSLPLAVFAAWSTSPTVNNAISTAAGNQNNPQLVSDGSSGAIITWQDARSDANGDIYAQRVNATGTVQWTANGLAISTAANGQSSPQLVADGAGGAIITWYDYRSGTNNDIYAQRVDSSGAVLWTANGVAISTAANHQAYPQLVSDGAGGAIITWYDIRSGTNNDIYAQRVDSSGAVQWTANGVAISTALNDQINPQIVADGSAGAIITWQDYRSGTNYDIYAQRVNTAGDVQWTANGVAIATTANPQSNPQLVADGSAGAIITWRDSGSSWDIYAQRVDSSGSVLWTANGVAISTASDTQWDPELVADGSAGAIITWEDARSGISYDIYAQRVNASGSVQWMANGLAISTAANNQRGPQIIADGSAGGIITWYDDVGDSIYAQRVNAAGSVLWTANGLAISTASDNQRYPQLVADGSAGAIITWQDGRSGNNDIYAQRVLSTGILGDPPPPPPPPPPSPPSPPDHIIVGVEVYPPDNLALLAPWLVLVAILALVIVGGILTWRRRRAH